MEKVINYVNDPHIDEDAYVAEKMSHVINLETMGSVYDDSDDVMDVLRLLLLLRRREKLKCNNNK